MIRVGHVRFVPGYAGTWSSAAVSSLFWSLFALYRLYDLYVILRLYLLLKQFFLQFRTTHCVRPLAKTNTFGMVRAFGL